LSILETGLASSYPTFNGLRQIDNWRLLSLRKGYKQFIYSTCITFNKLAAYNIWWNVSAMHGGTAGGQSSAIFTNGHHYYYSQDLNVFVC
jgi:hypothetical protein